MEVIYLRDEFIKLGQFENARFYANKFDSGHVCVNNFSCMAIFKNFPSTYLRYGPHRDPEDGDVHVLHK